MIGWFFVYFMKKEELIDWLKAQIENDDILHWHQKDALLSALDFLEMEKLQELKDIFMKKDQAFRDIQRENDEFFANLSRKARLEVRNFENKQRKGEIETAEDLLVNL